MFRQAVRGRRVQEVDSWNLIGVAITLAVAAGIPALFPRLPVPGVVLEILFGVVFGPQVLAIVMPGPAFPLLYHLGLSMLFLIAGLRWIPPSSKGGRCAMRSLAG